MYTSCGWFFDDLSGIETVQIIQYAGRVLQLARETLGVDLEPRFLETLEEAKSNIPEQGDGRQIYEKWVKPAVVDLETVGAHYAMSSIFEDYGDRTSIYCFNVDREDYQSFDAGRAKLVTGRAKVISGITQKSAGLSFGVLYFGDHTLNCGVGEDQVQDSYQSFVDEVSDFFARGDFPETIRTLDRYFGHSPYSLKSLFRDEQRKILYLMLENTLKEAEAAYRQLYEYHAPMMHYLKDLGVPAPKALSAAAELALNIALRRAFENEEMDPELIQSYLNETKEEGISLDAEILEHTLRRSLESMADRFAADPTDISILQNLETAVGILESLPFKLNLRRIQNTFYTMLQSSYPEFKARSEQGDPDSREWVAHFLRLGDRLSVRISIT
jgi:hypothetical protein